MSLATHSQRLHNVQPLWRLPLALLLLCSVVLGGSARSERTEVEHAGFVDQVSPLGLFIHNQYACVAERLKKSGADADPIAALLPATMILELTPSLPKAPAAFTDNTAHPLLTYSRQAPRAPPSV